MSDFALWRTVLLPVVPGISRTALETALANGGSALEAEIRTHHMAPMWHARTEAPVFTDTRRTAALAYLKQRVAVEEIDALFGRDGIPYAVIKGVATREIAYDEPALRQCADIDVLVSHRQRLEAARALIRAGYLLKIDPSVVSHEVGLTRNGVGIDLHWDILRPGRTPQGFAEEMLERRVWHGTRWQLSDTDAMFLMLVHAAISKHVSTDGLGLHRAADFVLFLDRRRPEWPRVVALLERSGLKTAAWAVLTWLRSLVTGPALETQVDALRVSVEPGRLRGRYLKLWIDRDLSARLAHRHAARLIGFSMLLHDRPTAAWQAWVGFRHAMKTAAADEKSFTQLLPR